MAQSLKEKIFSLRREGLSYKKIAEQLHCSTATICYHCQRHNLNNIGLRRTKLTYDEIEQIQEYYKNNSLNETAKFFKVSTSTVKRYVKKKRQLLTIEERKVKNYQRVKSHRQKIKIKAIEYKGGKCEKCSYDKCKWALDFHHINKEEKDFNIARYGTLSWEKIKVELDKCIMVCANCHREIHYDEYFDV